MESWKSKLPVAPEPLRMRLDVSLCCVEAASHADLALSFPFAEPGKYFPDYLDPADASTIVEVLERVMEEEASASIVASFDATAGGAPDVCDRAFVWLEMAASAIVPKGEDGAVLEIAFRDVTVAQNERVELEHRIEFESLVGQLTRRFLSAEPEAFEGVIEEGLRRIAEAMNAARVSLLCTEQGTGQDPCTFMYEPSGQVPHRRITRQHIGRFPWCARQLRDYELIEIPDVSLLPAEAEADREILASLRVSSVLAVPAYSGGQIAGILTVHGAAPVPAFPEEEKRLLRIVAEVCTGALARRRSERDLRQSEERFRALAENTQDGICELAEDGSILYASPSYAEMVGRSSEDLVGSDPLAFADVEDRDRLIGTLRPGVIASPKSTLVYRAQRPLGGIQYLEANAREFIAQDGRPHLVVATRDVTERELARLALEHQIELENRVAELSRFFLDCEVDAIRAGIEDRLAVVADLAGVQHSWLYSFVTGVDGSELFDWWDQEDESRKPVTASNTVQQFPYSTGLIMRGEVYRVPNVQALPAQAASERRDMQKRRVRSILAIPIMSEGRFVGVLGFESFEREVDWSKEIITLLRIVGEIFFSSLRRRAAARALSDSQSQLLQAQKMEAVGTLAGGIAHDFNNHLAVMLGNARFVRQEVHADEEVIEAIDDIERAADHCAQLTRSLLAFSRRTPVQIVPVDAAQLVRSVEGLVRPLLPSSVSLATTLTSDLGSFAADHVQIQQVLVNLLVNARDAMPEGGAIEMDACRRALSVAEASAEGLSKDRDYVVLRVRDAGCGMDQETQGRVFEPFFTTKSPGSGTGLGLATAYGIVRQSGGAIGVQSAPGEGSTFHVYLPVIESDSDAQD